MRPEGHPMSRSWSRALLWVGASLWAAWPAEASAQSARGTARTSPMAGTPGAFANPYMNPYTNPFLNPYATLYPMSGQDAALSFLAAQHANGGLGSGRISGVRPSGRDGGLAVAPPAPNGTTAVPGAAASRYFNRGLPASSGPRAHYNRPSPYYQNFRR
jgi:hypothetical protein